MLFRSACTLIAWSWTGYPIKGPIPHIHGPLTIIAQAVGLLFGIHSLSGHNNSLMRHPLWLTVGATSTYVLYSRKDWVGYSGGLIFAAFSMSIIPLVLQNATTGFDVQSRSGTAKTYCGAFFVLILLLLANVWTVAYAFVPGGVYLRERTDL